MAVPREKQSEILGQRASSQTVLSVIVRNSFFTSRVAAFDPGGRLSHSGNETCGACGEELSASTFSKVQIHSIAIQQQDIRATENQLRDAHLQ